MIEGKKDYLKLGDWNAICDVCGFKFKASELRRRWDGFMVCDSDFEQRHPQDLIRVRPERSVPKFARPPQDDNFVNPYPTAPTIDSYTTAQTTTGTSITVDTPANAVAGDLMLLFCANSGSSKTWTPPAGWTTIFSGIGASSLNVHYKVVTTNEPADHTSTISSSIAATSVIVLLKNAAYHATTGYSTDIAATAQNLVIPSLTVSSAAYPILLVAASCALPQTYTVPSNLTPVVEYTDQPEVTIYADTSIFANPDGFPIVSGTTGVYTINPLQSGATAGGMFVITGV